MSVGLEPSTERILHVTGPQTICDVERELCFVEANRPSQLLLPVKPKDWWVGGEASLIQLLITWGRRSPDATLLTYLQQGQDPKEHLHFTDEAAIRLRCRLDVSRCGGPYRK